MIAPTKPPRSSARRLLDASACACALLLFCYAFRAPLLTGVANAWVVNDPATKVDAIVVLGGAPESRPFEAARLYGAGLAPRVLYMDVIAGPLEELGIALSERELTHRILLSNNVPETALFAVGHGVASTFDESRAVRAWVATNAVKSILIATDLFHTRRARWIFARELRGTGVKVLAYPVQPRAYGPNNWWRHEEGLIAFQNEAFKSLYYWCKY